MQIIKDDAKLVFNSWDEIVSEIKQKNVKNPDISTAELLNDIEKIKEISQKTFFSKPQFPYLSGLLNQIRLYEQGKRYSFIEDLHNIGRLITGLQVNSKSKRLFEKKIFSNFGFFSQFLASAWLNKYLKVVDFELNNPPFQTDILVDASNNKIHFHIKDITESEREERLSDLCIYVDYIFTEKARLQNYSRHLAVVRVEGVPPKNIPNNYWLDFASKLEEKPQKRIVIFPPNQGYGNSDEIQIKLDIGWRPFNGVFTSPTNSFNNSYSLASKYEEINNKILSNSQGQTHVLVLITEDKYSTRSIRKFVEGNRLGIVILEIFDYNFERSKFILPNNLALERYLNKNVPRYVEVVI